jgi:hypothetical protein
VIPKHGTVRCICILHSDDILSESPMSWLKVSQLRATDIPMGSNDIMLQLYDNVNNRCVLNLGVLCCWTDFHIPTLAA